MFHAVSLHFRDIMTRCDRRLDNSSWTDPASPVTAGPDVAELCPGGSERPLTVADSNAWVAALAEAWLGEGINRQLEAFRSGLSEVFGPASVAVLGCFSAEEINSMVGGVPAADWTMEQLVAGLTPGYGMTETTVQLTWLRELLMEGPDLVERAAFLQYCTSCPTLPPGGLPAGYIVVDKKEHDGLVAAEVLPTARTCTNQLRLPLYATQAELAERLRVALQFNTAFGAD